MTDFIFLGFKITVDCDWSHKIKRCLLPGRKAMIHLDGILKSRDITLQTKVPIVKAVIFPVMYRCESWTKKENWALKNWCFQIVVLEKTLESPLDSKEIKPVHPKGNQPWIFIGRTDAEAEAPIVWPPDLKSWVTGKDPDAGKDWRQEEKGETEDELLGCIVDSMGMSLSKVQEIAKDREDWCAAVHGVTKSWTGLSDWTTIYGNVILAREPRTLNGEMSVFNKWH